MTFRKTLLIGCLALLFAGAAEAAITRVSKRLGFVEFYAGYAKPVGTVDGYPVQYGEFLIGDEVVDADAEDIYNTISSFGLRFGQIVGGHTQVSFGLQYSNLRVLDDPEWSVVPETDFETYDLDFDLNFRFFNLTSSPFSPYIGAGLLAGLVRAHGTGIETEYTGTVGVTANFGAELKIWESNRGGVMTIASVNDYQLVATGDRPRYLNIGGALRYYFLP